MELFSWFTRPKDRKVPAERPAQARQFGGAEIIPQMSSSCSAVRSIAGKRFLSVDVPLIPLRGCDLPRCECTYRRYADRRTNVRRAADLGIGLSTSMARGSGERRNPRAPGRRTTDLDAN